MQTYQKRTWAEIDLDAAEHNFRQVRTGAMKCCVIKANAYGHGAVQLARLYEELGADWFAVSNIEEALQLRQNGIQKPILILGYSPVDCAEILARYDLSQTVYSRDFGKALSDCAVASGVRVRTHIKVDTGMGRLGFRSVQEEMETEAAEETCRLPGLAVEGIFTHFAVADGGVEGEAYTRQQFDGFMRMIRALEERDLHFSIRHCANSAAIFDYPEFHLDMVRLGVILYGLQPSPDVRCKPDLRPVMTGKSVITHVKCLRAGDSVSYGRTYTAQEERRVATVAVGYADGWQRCYGTRKVPVFVKGKPVKILGRICMDQMMIDVTDIPEAVPGDTVVIFGSGAQSADSVAEAAGTIGYEVLCNIGERVPKIYRRNQSVIEIKDNLITKV